jgi:ADP-heptose:LPS heptosyltransferase
VGRGNSKVLKNIEYIDKVIEINSNNLGQKLFSLRTNVYDIYINLSPTKISYLLCFFSKSAKKANMIFLSRYKRKLFSKSLLILLSKFFCNYTHVVNRFEILRDNKEIHQTKMIFELINKCNIKNSQDVTIDINLPRKKLNFLDNKFKIVTIHLNSKWINKHYDEKKFFELLHLIKNKDYYCFLTTDNSSRNHFIEIYNEFQNINNNNFDSILNLENQITILDKLKFENWVKIIFSSDFIITPECGCSHISAACNVPVSIIYDSENLPNAIHREYSPWKSKHNKLIFGENDLNNKLINLLN